MAIKKKKFKKSSLLYNIKTSEDKTERKLNKGKSGLKPSFKKEKKKEKMKVLPTRRYRSSFQVYDYSNLNFKYFADLYCYLRKYF